MSRDDRTKNPDIYSYHDQSKITLNNFIVEGAGPHKNDLRLFLRCIWIINANELKSNFNDSFDQIHFKLKELIRMNLLPFSAWEEDMIKMVEQVNQQFSLFFGGDSRMDKEPSFIKIFEKKLFDLKPITSFEEESPPLVTQEDILHHVNEIREEVKKGNRVSFKLLQELQVLLEEFTLSETVNEKEDLKKVVDENKQNMEGFLHLALKSIDSMDLIYQSAVKTSLQEWGAQIKRIIDDFLILLESFGIEEIRALGEYIDGNTMISIGNVPREVNPELEKYQVYAVHERGFRFKVDGKLIREAKVITIY